MLTLTDTLISSNQTTGDYAQGGGIFSNDGDVSLVNSVVDNNQTQGNSADGGGIAAFSGSVTLSSSTVSGNRVTGQPSALGGGGIYTGIGSISVLSSTISGNSNENGSGGGVGTNFGTVSLENSTVSGNTAAVNGGGIFAYQAFALNVFNSTITNNSGGSGGGISIYTANDPLVTIQNSIIAENIGSGPDINTDTSNLHVDVDFSLIGNTNGSTITSSSGVGNLLNVDPRLAPLADNGGPTLTHALLVGTPALDAGDPAAVAGQNSVPAFDQRGDGFERVTNGRLDIGAVEAVDVLAPIADVVDVAPDPRNSNVGVVTIDFNEDVTGVDINDLLLTRDGAVIDLTGLNLTQISPRQYTIDLSTVTTVDGNYELKVNSAGSGISDSEGNALASDAIDQFMIDSVGPQVESVVINGGDSQRSMVSEIKVTFSEDVGVVDASHFILTNVTTNTQIIPVVAYELIGGKTVATLTFEGSGIIGGSLADGDYTLVTLDTVTDAAGNQLDGDNDGNAGGNAMDDFFRFFGDVNGDRNVNFIDFIQFRGAFGKGGSYNPAFDFNNDGKIDFIDFIQFRSRFGGSL